MIRPPRITFPVAPCHGCGDPTEHRYHAGVPCCDECQRACDTSLAHCDAASHRSGCAACATWRRVIGVDLRAPATVDDSDLAELDALYAARAENDRDAHHDDASLSTRDDGFLMHGRLPADDVDALNPCIVAVARSKPADYSPLPGHVPPVRLRLIVGPRTPAVRAESGTYETAARS